MKTNIIIAFTLLLLLNACKKDNPTTGPRKTVYTLVPQNNSGVSGSVSFIENVGLSQTEVDLEVSNADLLTYVAHIHQGPPARYHGAIYIFQPIIASNGKISYQQFIPLLYDSAIVYDGTFVLHDSTANNILALCGVGINR